MPTKPLLERAIAPHPELNLRSWLTGATLVRTLYGRGAGSIRVHLISFGQQTLHPFGHAFHAQLGSAVGEKSKRPYELQNFRNFPKPRFVDAYAAFMTI